MQDYKHRGNAPRKPWLKRRFGLVLRRRNKAALPKGFKPLPVPPAAKRESALAIPRRRLVRAPLSLIHGVIVCWLIAGVLWHGADLINGPLQKVQLSGNLKLTGAQALAATGLAPGLPMSQVDPIQVTRLLAAQPIVAAVDVRRVYPGNLWIDVRERTPDLRVVHGERWALVDAHNVVVEHGDDRPPKGPPLVRGTHPLPAPGEVLRDPSVHRGREFLRQMREADLPVEQVMELDATQPYMMTVRLGEGRRMLFSTDRAEQELQVLRELTASPALGAALEAPGRVVDLRASVAEDGRIMLRP